MSKGRLEAFSDGVFAIAITLLVLDLKVPQAGSERALLTALGNQWPVYLAYVTSFATVLIMWVNHHTIFSCVARPSHTLFLLNGWLLLLITIVPWPTSLLAHYLAQAGESTATAVYTGFMVVISVAFNLVWRYVAVHPELHPAQVTRSQVDAITRRYRFGPLWYLLAFLVTFLSALAALGICLALAIKFSLPSANAGASVEV